MSIAEAPVKQLPAEQRFRLSCVDWPSYLAMAKALEGRHVRLTYDRGEMELMTVSPLHERYKKLLARMLEALTEELGVDIASYGATTFKREDLEKGLEPDECYWIAHERQMRGRDDIDLNQDPPPDLAIEVEVSRSVLSRLGIYAALGVPEVWRYDGRTVRYCLLGPDGRYADSPLSQAFPFLPAAALLHFLTSAGSLGETQLIRAF